MANVIEEMVDAYVAAGLENAGACFVNQRPDAISTGCTVLTVCDGETSPTLTIHTYRVQVAVYRGSQAAALSAAQEAFDALHTKRWALRMATHSCVSLFALQPPFHEPPVEVTGGRLYVQKFNVSARVR